MQFKTTPYDHQLTEYEISRDMKIRALLWEQGVGKTKPVIDTAAYLALEGEIDGLLVVAPNGVHRNWVMDEIPIHLSDDIRDSTRVFDWRTKSAKTKRYKRELDVFHQASEFNGGKLAILCISYSAMMTKEGAEATKQFLQARRCMQSLDESQYIKSAGAKRTTRLLNMGRHSEWRRIMSGTPITNNPFDLYPQMKYLDPGVWAPHGISTFAAFKSHFGVWRTRTIEVKGKKQQFEQLVDFKNQEILKQIIAQYGSRLVKDDVLDLPPKIFQKRYFELAPAQRRAYEELVNDCRTHFSGGRCTAVLPIAKLLRLQQVTSGYLPNDDPDDPRLYPVCDKHPRMDVMKDIISEQSGKVIVWAKYQNDIDKIMDELSIQKRNALQFDGRTSDDAREHAKVAFQKGSCQFLVANPAAAGTGLTLHAAETEIFYNTTYKYAERVQAEDRAHRAGMPDRPVTIIDICAQDTIDERIIERLREKKDIADHLLGDVVKDWI